VEKFAPQLKTVIVIGNRDDRLKRLEAMEDADIVITSYPLLRRDIDEYKGMAFRYCILDEAQHIKNQGSINVKAAKEITARNKFALTGTPMENSLSELWSVFDFVLPGYLFNYTRFSDRYEKPIIRESDKKALEELGDHIRPFVLRRLKTDVLKELPEKIESKMLAELTEEQTKLYLAYIRKIKGEIEEEIREKGFARSQIKILAGLTRLRQICCHPGVFVEDYEGDSGKMQLLKEIISDSIEAGHRILLFSQFTSMLGIIRRWLDEEVISYMYLDGSTEAEERIRLVKAFNAGRASFFSSL
jgi:SNF2 family DNA or RNA helicase